MPRNAVEIAQILSGARETMRKEFMRISLLDRKIKGQLGRTWMPPGADAEYKDLFRKASGPWLEFTRDAIAQGIRVDGCNNETIWKKAWQENGMDGRQGGINREAVGLGKSFLLVVPAGRMVDEIQVDEHGQPLLDEFGNEETIPVEVADNDRVVMRTLSPLVTYAHYRDSWDEHPEWVLTRVGDTKAVDFWTSRWVFIDDEALYRFDGGIETPTNLTTFVHERDYTPVALIPNTLPTYGEPESSVERAITTYQRIVDATFTLEMVQRYGAFPQKHMAGGTLGNSSDGRPVNVAADTVLHSSDPTTRFGNFDPGSLTDVAVAVDTHIKHLAAVCQVPPHYLLGAVVNMSAEGIAAAESGYFRNIGDRQDSMSEGYELAMRIAGEILGLDAEELAKIQIHFEDVSSRSLSQVADAIGKLALLAPDNLATFLAMVPGLTQLDAQAAAARSRRVEKQVQSAIQAPAATPPTVPEPAATS